MESVRLAGLDTGCSDSTPTAFCFSPRPLAPHDADFLTVALPDCFRSSSTNRAGAPLPVRVLPRRSLTLAIISLLLVVGCGKKPPVTPATIVREVVFQKVLEPVPVIVMPPPELLAPFTMPLPIFISPSDPLASSALTVEQERALRAWVEERASRWDAFIAWVMSLAAQR